MLPPSSPLSSRLHALLQMSHLGRMKSLWTAGEGINARWTDGRRCKVSSVENGAYLSNIFSCVV